MAQGVKRESDLPRRLATGSSGVAWWPALALLLLPAAESLKSAGFRTVFGVDLTLMAVVAIATVALPAIASNGYPIKTMAPLLVFWGVEAMSTLRTFPSNYSDEKTRAFFLITGVAVFLLPAFVRTLPQIRGWLAVLLAASGITLFLTMTVPQVSNLGRVTLGGNPLVVAYWCALGILLAALIFVMHRDMTWRLKVLLLISVAAFSLPLLETGSRGPLVALVVALLLGVMGAGSKRLLTSLMVMAVVGAALFYALRVAPDVAAGRVLQMEDASRLQLRSLAFEAFGGNPFFGIGFGNFYWLSPYLEYPHNVFAEVAAEGGLLGLASLAWIGVAFVRSAWVTRTVPAAWIASMVAVFWMVASSFSGAVEGRMLWLSITAVLLLPYALEVSGTRDLGAGASQVREPAGSGGRLDLVRVRAGLTRRTDERASPVEQAPATPRIGLLRQPGMDRTP